MKKFLPLSVASLLILFGGCEIDATRDLQPEVSGDVQGGEGEEADHEGAEAEAEAALGAGTDAIVNNTGTEVDLRADLSNVTFLHTNVSRWPVTSNLSSVRVSGGSITLNYDKARSWPGVSTAGAHVNANPWILVRRNGQWYAGTWEWLRTGQTRKSARAVNGDHIKQSPLDNFRPQSGEVYGFMVSGLARTGVRNVQERTNVVMVRWP